MNTYVSIVYQNKQAELGQKQQLSVCAHYQIKAVIDTSFQKNCLSEAENYVLFCKICSDNIKKMLYLGGMKKVFKHLKKMLLISSITGNINYVSGREAPLMPHRINCLLGN